MIMVDDHPVYRVADDLFANPHCLEYGEYNYTDRNPIRSSENAWYRVAEYIGYRDIYDTWF